MKSAFRVTLISILVFVTPYLLAMEHFKAKMADQRESMAKIERSIDSQRVYNTQNEGRIRAKARISAILSEYKDSLHHNPVLLADIILMKCEQFNLDPYLVLGMIKTESSFNSQAVSSKGALGLMQIRPGTASYLAPNIDAYVKNGNLLINDNELNITLGTLYISRLIRKFGSLRLALEAYNRGPNGLTKEISIGDYTEPLYSIKVISNYRKLKSNRARLQYRG